MNGLPGLVLTYFQGFDTIGSLQNCVALITQHTSSRVSHGWLVLNEEERLNSTRQIGQWVLP
jgi:hypothetical protein